MLPLIGSLVSAGAGLLGSAMNNSANAAAQEKANQQNYEAQKEFAQNGLRWKIADAKAAGIHPVYAVGAPTQSFQASFGASQSDNGLAQAGQDIGRAISTTQTASERNMTMQMNALSLERATLENDLLRTQIRRQLVESGPAFPTLGGSAAVPANLSFHGNSWKTNPKTSDTQAIEDRYGDALSWLYGIGVAASDTAHNAAGTSTSGGVDYSRAMREAMAKQQLASKLRGDPLQFLWDALNPPRDPYAGIFR